MVRRWGALAGALVLAATTIGCGSTAPGARREVAGPSRPSTPTTLAEDGAAPSEADDGPGGAGASEGTGDDLLAGAVAGLADGYAFSLGYAAAEVDGSLDSDAAGADLLAGASLDGTVDGDGDLSLAMEVDGEHAEVVRTGEGTWVRAPDLPDEGWYSPPPELLPYVLSFPGMDPRGLLARIADATVISERPGAGGGVVVEADVPEPTLDDGDTGGDGDEPFEVELAGLAELVGSAEAAQEAIDASGGDVALGVLLATFAPPGRVVVAVDAEGTLAQVDATYPIGLVGTVTVAAGPAEDVQAPESSTPLTAEDLGFA